MVLRDSFCKASGHSQYMYKGFVVDLRITLCFKFDKTDLLEKFVFVNWSVNQSVLVLLIQR